jgi:hypothetical protein
LRLPLLLLSSKTSKYRGKKSILRRSPLIAGPRRAESPAPSSKWGTTEDGFLASVLGCFRREVGISQGDNIERTMSISGLGFSLLSFLDIVLSILSPCEIPTSLLKHPSTFPGIAFTAFVTPCSIGSREEESNWFRGDFEGVWDLFTSPSASTRYKSQYTRY